MQMRQRGFTLIELLVAIALLGVIAVLSYRGLDSVRQSEAHISTEAESWRRLSRIFERLGQDVLYTVDRPHRDLNGGLQKGFQGRPQIGDLPDEAQLIFVRQPPASGLDQQKLGYRWRQERLELLLWPSLDAGPQAAEAHVLLEGVRMAKFDYLDRTGAWQNQWPLRPDENLPRAIRLAFTLADGKTFERIFALP